MTIAILNLQRCRVYLLKIGNPALTNSVSVAELKQPHYHAAEAYKIE